MAEIYSDFIFKDIPFLVRWLKMEWSDRWKHEFSEHTAKQTAEYYFNTYLENWERPEVKSALESVPALMQWDGMCLHSIRAVAKLGQITIFLTEQIHTRLSILIDYNFHSHSTDLNYTTRQSCLVSSRLPKSLVCCFSITPLQLVQPQKIIISALQAKIMSV